MRERDLDLQNCFCLVFVSGSAMTSRSKSPIPKKQEIVEFYVVQKRRRKDFRATNLQKGRSGHYC